METCWIITEGLKGTENQCIALADALGLAPMIKVVKLKQPWKTLFPWIPGFSPKALAKGSSAFNAPWPNLIIASGRKAIAPALWVKRQSKGKAKLVIVQNPVIRHKEFDLVIVPKHDCYKGKNAMEITGALSLVTPEKLALAREEWESVLGALPAPRVAVSIGGTSRAHRITSKIIERLIAQLRDLQAQGYSLMITASRRTPPELTQTMREALASSLAPSPHTHFYDGQGANPYLGYLAWADAILVTEDSVSMASEAISTGKPVHIIPLIGGSARFRRFHEDIVANGYARWFDGNIGKWEYEPPPNMVKLIDRIK